MLADDPALYALLGKLARPFVDHDPMDVVRWLAEEEAKRRGVLSQPVPETKKNKNGAEVLDFDGLNPPDLTFTHATILSVDGVRGPERGWNPCLRELANRLPPDTDFEAVIPVNFARGQSGDDSMMYCKHANISIQYQDANRAWRTIVAIARHLGLSVQADFKWRLAQEGKEPAYPGRAGRLILSVSSSGKQI